MNCLFCNIIKEKRFVIENELAVAFFDSFPVNDGHALIIPKRHASTFFDLTKEEIANMYDLAQKMKELIDNKFQPDGYNIGFNVGEYGGQTIMHAHMHIIPRYKGDDPTPRGGIRKVVKNPKTIY